MAERKTFLFFCSWAEILSEFPPEDRCSVYDAIIAYAEDGSLPVLKPVLNMAFKFIKKDIDEMQAKYESVCAKRRDAINKRWEKQRNSAIQENTKVSDEYKCIQENTNVSSVYKSYKSIHSKHEHEHNHEHEHETTINCSRENNITHVRDGTGGYDSDNLLSRFFAQENSGKIEELVMGLHIGIADFQRMAQDIVTEWTLTEQKHTDYNDASRHLIALIRKKVFSQPRVNPTTIQNQTTQNGTTDRNWQTDTARIQRDTGVAEHISSKLAAEEAGNDSDDEPPW